MDHLEFEKKLMETLLAGDDPTLEGLRHQYLNSNVKKRQFTGAGFFTNFSVKDGIEPVAKGKTFQIDDIDASMGSAEGAIGFILFVEKGYLSMLEGYTLSSDVWPDDYSDVSLVYLGPGGKRDLEKLKAEWS